ncbi:MAG: 1-acyl-sn-glycerol-3-phosphate acyltransferase [Abditibacteriota bacterium]|nr:1-acyl-sn-glycerol-3-phosphate acyltransferase [Abditibacteriota bacterium]
MASKINLSYRIGRVFCRFFLTIFGPTKACYTENVPEEGPVCLMPNHISYLDPPVTGAFLNRKVYFMAKAELFKIPVLGPLIRSFGAFPVTRGVADRRALARAMELMRAGEVVNIFPEGKRSETGEICDPNRGSFDLALKCGAVIIPTLIVGTEKSLSTINPKIHKAPVKVLYGKPLDTEKYKDLPKDEMLSNLVRDWKETLYNLKKEVSKNV